MADACLSLTGMAEARVPSDPPSKPTIAITLNTLDAVQVSVVELCYKPDTIPNLTFGEMPLDIGKKLTEQDIQRDSECACL